jgi:hypothetical protein
MNVPGWYVTITLPLLVLGAGYAAVRYAEWDNKRRGDRLHPGE